MSMASEKHIKLGQTFPGNNKLMASNYTNYFYANTFIEWNIKRICLYMCVVVIIAMYVSVLSL